MSLLAVHPGAAYHLESLESGPFAHFCDRLVRPEDLARTELDAYDGLLVPCWTPADRMTPHRERLRAYLDRGGTIIATGESESHLFLPGLRFTPVSTNWWWWLDPAGDLGVEIAAPAHPLLARLKRPDVTWHLHGWYQPPSGAEVLVVDREGHAVMYVDEVTTAGRMVITSLDPFYHHGSHFMPATTRFLTGFLPALTGLLDGAWARGRRSRRN